MRRSCNDLQIQVWQAAAMNMGREACICELEWPLTQEVLDIKMVLAWDLLHHLLPGKNS